MPVNALDVTAVYDLKGSTAGRTTPEEKRKGPLSALKDNDLKEPLVLGCPKQYDHLMKTIDADAAFLGQHQLIDYSLLVCVADIKVGESEEDLDSRGYTYVVLRSPGLGRCLRAAICKRG